MDPAQALPLVSRGNRHGHLPGSIGQPVLVRSQDAHMVHRPRSRTMQAAPTQQPRHRLPSEALSALRRVEAFAIQVLGDLRKAVAGLAQTINAGQKGRDIGELVVTRHWTTY